MGCILYCTVWKSVNIVAIRMNCKTANTKRSTTGRACFTSTVVVEDLSEDGRVTVEEVLVEYDVVVRLCLGEASQTRGGNLSQRAAVDFVPHAADVDAHAVTCCSSRRHDDANTATKSRSPLSPVTVSFPHHCRCCIRRSVVSECGLFVATSTFNECISAI